MNALSAARPEQVKADDGPSSADIPLQYLNYSERQSRGTEEAVDSAAALSLAKNGASSQHSIQPPSASSRPTSVASNDEAALGARMREEAASALPPVDGGRQAWAFLFTAMLLEVLVWGLGNASGTFQDYHLSNPHSPLYGTSSSVSAVTSTLITAGTYFSPFLFTGYLTAFPQHISFFSAATLLISVLGYIGASLHPSPASVVLLQGFVAGWAGGAFYTPAMIWLPQWFDRRRGFATGVLFLGSGIGGIMWPFVISSLLDKVQFSWTLRVLALLQGLIGITIFFFMRPRLPPQRQSLATTTRSRRNVWKTVLPVHDKMVQTPLGIANSILQFLQAAAFWSISYYLSPYATSLGFSRATSTALLSVLNAATALSYLLTGRLCDAVPYAPLIIVVSTIGSIIVGLGLGFAQTMPSLFTFATLYGLANGGFSCIMSPAAREMAILGQTEHSAIFVEIMAFRGLGGVVGPLISSALYSGAGAGKPTSSAPWTDTAVWGSHGMGPIVIFTTICTVVVSLIGTSTIPMRGTNRISPPSRLL